MNIRSAPNFSHQDVTAWETSNIWGAHTLAGEFTRVAQARTNALAIATPEGQLTYGQLDSLTTIAAARLGEAGVEPGAPVLLQLTNRLRTVVAWYALLKAGAIPVATLAAFRQHELLPIGTAVSASAIIVETSQTTFNFVSLAKQVRLGIPSLSHIITFDECSDPEVSPIALHASTSDLDEAKERVERAQHDISPRDVCAFQLSGGTTGTPKLIPRRHSEYWYNARAYAERLRWSSEVRVAHLGPLVHNAGIVCGLHAPASVGGAVVLLGAPDERELANLICQFEVTDMMVSRGRFGWVQTPEFSVAAKSLQRVMFSGGKVPRHVFDRVNQDGIMTGQVFGMGEGLFAVASPDAPEHRRANSVGTVLSSFDKVKILVPGTETDVPLGATGELCCKGPYTIPGYFRAAEHNTIAFTTDGYFRTGDLARIDRDQDGDWLFIEGRLKDLINRGGEKINAEEIELLLVGHPAIKEAALVAMPDDRLGEKACAFVVTHDAALTVDLPDLQNYLAAKGVAKYKWPERMESVESLPRTNVGKIDKKVLREVAVG